MLQAPALLDVQLQGAGPVAGKVALGLPAASTRVSSPAAAARARNQRRASRCAGLKAGRLTPQCPASSEKAPNCDRASKSDWKRAELTRRGMSGLYDEVGDRKS